MKAIAAYQLTRFIKGLLAIALTAVLLSGCGPAADAVPEDAGRTGPAETAPVRVDPQSIVFGSNFSGNFEIYRMSQDGSEIHHLTDDPAYDNWWPRISPDREKILFYRAPCGEGSNYRAADLMVMDADGGNIRLLRAAGDDGWRLQAHAEWSPIGDELVMCGAPQGIPHLFITDDQGGDPRQLTFDGTWNCDPSWSPDGRTIVFNRCEKDCGDRMANLEIYAVAASGGAPTRLTANTTADYDPYYSPDGSAIGWLTNVRPSAWDGIGAWSIYIMDQDGANPRSVIDDGQINSKPAWSLNGEIIFFHRLAPAAEAENRWRIHSIHPDGTHLTAIDPFDSGHSEYPAN